MIVCVYGLGSIGRRHLSNLISLKKELKISEIRGYDVRISNVVKRKFDDQVALFTNFKNASKDIGAAFVCSPTHLHISTLNNLLKYANPHVYLEKPFSDKLLKCVSTNNKFIKIKKKIFVGYMLINHPVIMKVKELLNKKKIGKIIFARAESGFYLPFWHPWEKYQDFYMSKKNQGGGALLDTSHEINYLQWLFGRVSRVSGGSVSKVSDLEITSDDLTFANLYFKNFIAQVHLDLLQFDEERELKVIGSKGIIKASLKNNYVNIYELKLKKWKKINFNFKFDKVYFTQIRYFFRSINSNSKINLINAKEAIHTMEIVEAIRKSSNKKGQIVKI